MICLTPKCKYPLYFKLKRKLTPNNYDQKPELSYDALKGPGGKLKVGEINLEQWGRQWIGAGWITMRFGAQMGGE